MILQISIKKIVNATQRKENDLNSKSRTLLQKF